MGGGGADLVIGNPPYIQLGKIDKELRGKYKKVGYKTFVGRGDIYQLFFERGCDLLKPGSGILGFITSNNWLKIDYGKSQRRFFHEHHPIFLIDIGKGVFEQATVEVAIFVVRSGDKPDGKLVSKDFPATGQNSSFPPNIPLGQTVVLKGDSPWCILDETGHAMLEKIMKAGRPLREWDVEIKVGVSTGADDAFLVSDNVRKSIMDKDKKSGKIFKPAWTGEDLEKWHTESRGKWLIAVPTDGIDIDRHPEVKRHLMKFGAKKFEVVSGAKKYSKFKEDKLVWIDVAAEGRSRVTYDTKGVYCIDSTYFMTGENLKYLCAMLNSRVLRWFMENMAPQSGAGATRWKKIYVGEAPIPSLNEAGQRPYVELVDKLIKAKTADPKADVSAMEEKLDKMVFKLYDLSEVEIKVIKEG